MSSTFQIFSAAMIIVCGAMATFHTTQKKHSAAEEVRSMKSMMFYFGIALIHAMILF